MAIYSKSPTALLLDKINAANIAPVTLTTFNCTIDAPTVIPITADGYNTEVKVHGIQGRGYIGVVTFQYTRLDLALLFKNAAPVIDSPVASTVYLGLPNLNARYGMNFTQDDVVNRSLVDRYAFTLTAKPGSLQFTGNVTGQYLNAGYRLNDIIYSRNLDTYVHPIDAADVALAYKSGGMIGYAIDYTVEANVITAMVAGPMGTGPNFTSGNSEALKQTMVGLGFPTWNYSKASIALYAAGIVAAANPKYLVAVITDVVDNNIKGPIYLHYNLQ